MTIKTSFPADRYVPSRRGHSLSIARQPLNNWGLTGRGFTLIEILAVLTITAVLVALIATAVGLARESARKVQCCNHLRQMATGIKTFAVRMDIDMTLPQMASSVNLAFWADQIYPYVNSPEPFACPSDRRPLEVSTLLASGAAMTTPTSVWYDLTVRYPSIDATVMAEFQKTALSYRGSAFAVDPAAPGGASVLGPKLAAYLRADKSTLLDEAWDNLAFGPRLVSRPEEVWAGYGYTINPNDPYNVTMTAGAAINFEPNRGGVGRHGGVANFLMVNESVQSVSAFDGPATVSHFLGGQTYEVYVDPNTPVAKETPPSVTDPIRLPAGSVSPTDPTGSVTGQFQGAAGSQP